MPVKRFSRRRTRGPRRQTSWINLANSTVSESFLATTSPTIQTQTDASQGTASFELLGPADLERFEEDVTILRCLGDLTVWITDVRLLGVAIDDPIGHVCRWGLYAMRDGANATVTVPNPNGFEDSESSWLHTGTTIQFKSSFVDTLHSFSFANEFSVPDSRFDTRVKRKLGKSGMLMLNLQFHPIDTAWASPLIQVTYRLMAHMRCLVAH